ncbi:MAG: AraC family transcriptional regulator, partial [Lachnospiraceae bacterium]
YIEENYKSSDISLNSVCDYLSISTSYFSMIFKNYTGETFIEALTKKRMEKAKLLLINTALKTYEIADEVGYSDPHYFSSIFKKATGETPTVYAKRKRMV